jgi:uncharacterized protein YciI
MVRTCTRPHPLVRVARLFEVAGGPLQYFVHGVDKEDVGEQLDRLAESHWAYMDAHVARLVARGPTLSADGTTHTGSVHVLDADTIEAARRFAFDEPYWLVGVYGSVTVDRFHNARGGTMWDRPRPPAGTPSSLVRVTWPAQPFAPTAERDAQVLRMLAELDPLVFGGLLICDDGTRSAGLVAAVDTGTERAASIVARVGLPNSTTSVTTSRWQRGGRDQT